MRAGGARQGPARRAAVAHRRRAGAHARHRAAQCVGEEVGRADGVVGLGDGLAAQIDVAGGHRGGALLPGSVQQLPGLAVDPAGSGVGGGGWWRLRAARVRRIF